MSRKAKSRFLKRIMIYCMVMASLLTIGALYISLKTGSLDGGVVAPLAALWSIELALGAWLKVTEGKTLQKKQDDSEGGI